MQRAEPWKEGAAILVKHFLKTPSQSPGQETLAIVLLNQMSEMIRDIDSVQL